MSANPLRQLWECGQSFWLDTISRELIRGGTLQRMVQADGLRGVTSNPDIFEKAITGSDLYKDTVRRLAQGGRSAAAIYEALAVDDIREAADILRPVYDESEGADGFVSLEVSPYLAYDASATVDEAKRLWAAVNRPNLMIKVPATPPGIAAIERLIAAGINVNVTLIFSHACYEQVMESYIVGLEEYLASGGSMPGPASVASFFVSRIDTLVDKLLGNRITAGRQAGACAPERLLGKAAVAAAKVAYANFRAKFHGPRFAALRGKGARVQRPLWASTSTKNPLYDATLYVAPLIGRDTVNTMPPATVDSWRNSGVVKPDTVSEGLDEAREVLAALESLGINLDTVGWQLQEEGVSKFNEPFDRLLLAVSKARGEAIGGWPQQSDTMGRHAGSVASVCAALTEARVASRLWAADTTLWPGDEAVRGSIANRLGWLRSASAMRARAKELMQFAAEVKKAGFRHVVLLGMGGSSLCPEVCARTFGSRSGYPELIVLDSTSPASVLAVSRQVDLRRTLFVPASKSGSTVETNTLFHYFWEQLKALNIEDPGKHFVGITDPGSSLEELGSRCGFRRMFLNPPDIGGRFSALSLFGLVPMALIGMDVDALLARTEAWSLDAGLVPAATKDEAVRLGAVLGALAQRGVNKLTLLISPEIESLGDWIEQLVAESTGKHGKGILPVVGEARLPVSEYGPDRLFAGITLPGDKGTTKRLDNLEAAGFPVVRLALKSREDLGIEFLRWEVATAIAGVVLGINPFDEPNVTESKRNTAAVLKHYKEKGTLPVPTPACQTRNYSLAYSAAGNALADTKRPVGLLQLLQTAGPGDYVALLAFVHPEPQVRKALEELRRDVGRLTGCPATLGIGPRYLHSTGQLHKGGPNTGVFIIIMGDSAPDLAIPGYDYSFNALIRAQALGDFQSLDAHDCRAVLVSVGADVLGGLRALREAISE
ncbi:MAG: bifunctional transaldolase/phosoglucose isomerase [Candidatus Sumerlaeaceae bacterium]|nr:bifunctional transaldolase/phosoglucose isomerase [Candidatus Sumerlaeaceae bacterium]